MAIRIDAAGDLLRTPNNVPSGDLTACFWTNQLSNPAAYVLLWGIGGNTDTSLNSFGLWMRTSHLLELYGANASVMGTTVATLNLNQWSFIALTGNTGNSQSWAVWIDTTKLTCTSPASGTYTAGNVDLGGSLDNINVFTNGVYAAYKHWSVKLTDAQVQAERLCYVPQYWSNLWAFCPLLVTGNLLDFGSSGNGFVSDGTVTTEDGPPIAWAPRQPALWTLAAPSAGFALDEDPWLYQFREVA